MDDLFSTGMKIRRHVLGDAHVDRSWAKTEGDDFQKSLQQIITTVGWGAVWGRGVLEYKQRSMLTLALVVALNRPHEIAIHLRGAIRNGCTREEIQEILIHCGCYCGWPAAVDAFEVARTVFTELDEAAAK
jgi:4-carboxymuconolactone decarboxylase